MIKARKGILLTAVYFITILALVGFRWPEFKCLPLNELGDFLAGAIGPIALIWLVFGYVQQGEELRQGTKALELQTNEFKNSVDQQSKIAAAQETSLRNYERSLEPLLKLDCTDAGWNEGEFYCSIRIENLGDYCEHVVATLHSSGGIARRADVDPLFSGASAGCTFSDIDEWSDFDVVVRYIVRSGRRHSQRFTFSSYFDRDCNSYNYSVKKHPFLNSDEAKV